MTATPVTHPTATQLAAFTAGRLNDADSAEIEMHLSDCAVCRTVLEVLPEDTLASLLRAGPTSAAGLTEDVGGRSAAPSSC